MPKVIDASPLFFQERQSGEVEKLYDVVQKQEVYNQKDLYQIIQQVNEVDVKSLPQKDLSKFQTLCGRVQTLNVNHKVDAIYDEVSALSEGEYHSSEELAKRIQVCKEMMAEVWHDNSLSPENTSYLRIASIKLSQLTETAPTSKIDDIACIPQVQEAIIEPEWGNAELSFDLFEVAQLLYEGKVLDANSQFRQLPTDIQESLGSIDPSFESIQNIVALAYEVVRGDGYVPSETEIKEMFQDVSNLS
ncbi:MAG: hypothetical protein KDK76_07910 [Chlamydiia bacterium]|nr:hypothetical protein [Chlamydiia bacterium]